MRTNEQILRDALMREFDRTMQNWRAGHYENPDEFDAECGRINALISSVDEMVMAYHESLVR